ncbi:MAG: DUF4249 domain-containing protein [Prolixibacteraceae bacterium]|nr:DUF4249 domain-containing protein [Prolixibacteraceae bacterium]
MKRIIYIGLILLLALGSCEDIYIADLEIGSQHLVVEAKIDATQPVNKIRLFRTVGFYESDNYPPVDDAVINLIDNNGKVFECVNSGNGNYTFYSSIDAKNSYKLQILYNGETYESVYETVPEIPTLDSVYGEATSKSIVEFDTDGNQVLNSYDGIQCYADIKNDISKKYYRFDARKIRLSNYPFDTIMGTPVTVTKYIWNSFYPDEGYNIATSSPYSNNYNIYKHTMDFINAQFSKLLNYNTGERERGWIYIIHQYSISTSAYQFYEELNKQLESEGKIFDPVYSQAFGNIKCTSDKSKVILGNFEIQNYKEHRYFVKFINSKKEFTIERIDTFFKIPERGVRSIYPPDFWMN